MSTRSRSSVPASAGRSLPSYRRHRASGQAVVSLSGHDVYLGPHGSETSRREYDRLIAEFLAAGRRWPPPTQAQVSLLIDELILRYWEEHVTQHYVKAGAPTSEQSLIRSALRSLRELYGHTPAGEFSPLGLKAVQERLLQRDLSRGTVNRYTNQITRMFRWATAEELVPADLLPRLRSRAPLRAGKTSARECEPVRPVSDAAVDEVLPFVSPPVRAMIQLQRLTGMRPGEVVLMRTADLDTQGDVWVYRPGRHNLEHKQQLREVFLGPQAQAVLRPWLRTDLLAYLFQPAETKGQKHAAQQSTRRSILTSSFSGSTAGLVSQSRRPTDHYTIASYRRAITRGCEAAYGMPEGLRRIAAAVALLPEQERAAARDRLRQEASAWRKQHAWHSNQLRHAAATEIRKRFGIDAARTVLGHSHLATTEIHAEQDLEAATRIMGVLG